MLEIRIPPHEFYNEKTFQFVAFPGQTLQLEHSLLSISKWEAITHKPFLDKNGMTPDDFTLYVRCMTLNKNVDEQVYDFLTPKDKKLIASYIENPMTATWFGKEEEQRGRVSRKVITSELIYYWMIAANVPMSCEKWHLNRLMTLLHICEIKNRPPKKGKRRNTAADASLNAARRAASGSRG